MLDGVGDDHRLAAPQQLKWMLRERNGAMSMESRILQRTSQQPQRPVAKKAAPAAAVADPVAAAKAVKALVSQFGAETVKGLADLFSK